jgi:hypothetical protein
VEVLVAAGDCAGLGGKAGGAVETWFAPRGDAGPRTAAGGVAGGVARTECQDEGTNGLTWRRWGRTLSYYPCRQKLGALLTLSGIIRGSLGLRNFSIGLLHRCLYLVCALVLDQ